MKVDFYILENDSKQKALYFACNLIEKIYNTHETQIYIHAETKEDAAYIDALLWTYRDDSFLPHHIYNPYDAYSPPIQIGYNNPIPSHSGVLINLHPKIPDFYLQFHRIIEIVFSDPLVQQLARERYKQYRVKGSLLNTYKEKVNQP